MKQIIVALLFQLPGMSVFAEEVANPPPEDRGYIGGLVGLGVVTSNGMTFFTYGARGGYGLFQDKSGIFSLGVYLQSISQTATIGAVTASDLIIGVSGELITRKIFGTGLYVGGRFGVGISSSTITSGSNTYAGSTNRFLVGPVLGYEIPIVDKLALALDVAWVSIGGGAITLPGLGTFTVNGGSAFTFLGGLLINF